MTRALTALLKALATGLLLLMVLSFVPFDAAYARVEGLLSRVGPLGSASHLIRSIPSTARSIMLEVFQGHTLDVEGVHINLDYAVNPTDRVERRAFLSDALAEERTYWVYLPPGYEGSTRRYPSLYLLHGMSQGHRWWTEVARVDRIATAMIESGTVEPMIIVMPNGNRVEQDVSTTSLYDDHCDTGLDVVARALKALGDRLRGLRIYKVSCDGDFPDFLARELVAEVDGRYRTTGVRYVGGFSIGGRGALQLAMLEGDVYNGGFGLSGNYDFLRNELRQGRARPSPGTKLLLGSGTEDQRGVYGGLTTYLFHKEMVDRGVDHVYCTYDGTHSDVAWVSAMPLALRYLFPSASTAAEWPVEGCTSSIGGSPIATARAGD